VAGFVVLQRNLLGKFVVTWGMLTVTVWSWGQADWLRTEKQDPLTDMSYVRFALAGKFLQAPNRGDTVKPTLVLECDPSKTKWRGTVHGKLLRVYIQTGAVLDSEVASLPGLLGTTPASLVNVKYRRDDEKKIQQDAWEHSKDFSALFLSYHSGGLAHDNGEMRLNRLFYGHDLIHKEGPGEQVHKIVISVPEYLGADLVMQFDLPDVTAVADSCGLIEHKR